VTMPSKSSGKGARALGLRLQEVSDRYAWGPPLHLQRVTKKAHDWAVDQIADLFRTTHKVKTQQVARSRGQRCGDIELAGYLAKTLVLDLRIALERWGSSSDPSINGHLHYPNDLDRPLHEAAADTIHLYRADDNNRPSNAISFMPTIASLVHSEAT
jgi:hypothetical protein